MRKTGVSKKLITIGIPCFNEEENIYLLYKKVKKIINSLTTFYNFEIIFVDNGSNDKTNLKIKTIIRKDKIVKGIFLSRNFGVGASGNAIIDSANGDALILLACDFQDPPELIPKLIKKWSDGYDVVLGQYKETVDSKFMAFMRKSFYSLYRKMSNIDVPINVTGFGLFSRRVVISLRNLPERYRFGRGLLMWLGYKKFFLKYKRPKRVNGISSYGFWDYVKDSEKGIFGFSYLPLDLMVYFGFLLTLVSFSFIIGYLIVSIVFGNPIKASISLMSAVVFFGGLNLMALSIIGKYIQIIVEEVKNRPLYIIDEKINFE